MLYNIIRDFFVQHVWGGTLANGNIVITQVGHFTNGNQFFTGSAIDYFVPVNGIRSGYGMDAIYIRFSDWLSTTSTIITLVVILVCIAFFIRWIFKVCSNAILLR